MATRPDTRDGAGSNVVHVKDHAAWSRSSLLDPLACLETLQHVSVASNVGMPGEHCCLCKSLRPVLPHEAIPLWITKREVRSENRFPPVETGLLPHEPLRLGPHVLTRSAFQGTQFIPMGMSRLLHTEGAVYTSLASIIASTTHFDF